MRTVFFMADERLSMAEDPFVSGHEWVSGGGIVAGLARLGTDGGTSYAIYPTARRGCSASIGRRS